MGFRYAKGLARRYGSSHFDEHVVSAHSIPLPNLTHRVPELRRNELVLLASIGALNSIGCDTAQDPLAELQGIYEPARKQHLHRRDALWQVERAARFAGPLLDGIPESDGRSPLAQMTPEERLVADFHGTGLTVGPHPMSYRRADLRRARVLSAKDLAQMFPWSLCPRRRLRHSASAARNRERVCVPQPGG